MVRIHLCRQLVPPPEPVSNEVEERSWWSYIWPTGSNLPEVQEVEYRLDWDEIPTKASEIIIVNSAKRAS